MSTTVQDLIDRARSRSSFNDPGLATDAEFIRHVDLGLKAAYQRAYNVQVEAGVEPSFFGKLAGMVGVAGEFTPPADAIAVYHIQTALDERVSIVNVDDFEAELPPRVYRLGASFFSPGGTGDPGLTDTLVAFYAHTHPDLDDTLAPDNAANTLASSWRESHNSLLVADLCAFLAQKDGRDAELQQYATEIASLWVLFDQSVLAYHLRESTRHV